MIRWSRQLRCRIGVGSEIRRIEIIFSGAAINSADEAAAWAHRNLPAKNTLTAADAKIVEERFQARLSTIGDSEAFHGISDRPIPCGAPDGPHQTPHAVAHQSGVSVSGPDAG